MFSLSLLLVIGQTQCSLFHLIKPKDSNQSKGLRLYSYANS